MIPATISIWEWGRIRAHRVRQKIPLSVMDHKLTNVDCSINIISHLKYIWLMLCQVKANIFLHSLILISGVDILHKMCSIYHLLLPI